MSIYQNFICPSQQGLTANVYSKPMLYLPSKKRSLSPLNVYSRLSLPGDLVGISTSHLPFWTLHFLEDIPPLMSSLWPPKLSHSPSHVRGFQEICVFFSCWFTCCIICLNITSSFQNFFYIIFGLFISTVFMSCQCSPRNFLATIKTTWVWLIEEF